MELHRQAEPIELFDNTIGNESYCDLILLLPLSKSASLGNFQMTMSEAIAHQPLWVRLWLDWLLFAALALPLALFIWKQTRFVAVVALIANIPAGYGTGWLYEHMGYVKLLGLAHIIFWTPLAIYLYMQLKRTDLPKWPRWIITVVLATIVISLAFDYSDALRYLMGERTPTFSPTTL